MKKKTSISLLIMAIGIYLIGVLVFKLYTFPRTSINDSKIGFVNQESIYHRDLSNFELTVQGQENRQAKISAQAIQYEVQIPSDFELNVPAWLWPLEIFRSHPYQVAYQVHYNQERLNELLDRSELLAKAEEPVNAKVDFDGEKYIITPEVDGSMPDKEKLISKIEEALNNQVAEIQLDAQDYKQAQVKKDNPDLVQQRDNLNEVSSLDLALDLGYEKFEIKNQELLNLFDRTDQGFELNEGRVREKIRQIAVETDTLGKARDFQTTGRGLVKVEGGIYGWQIDVDKTTQALIAKIKDKESGVLEPSYLRRGLERTKDNDIGNTYIEIDLTRQHLWFYKDNQLVVETDVVTGDSTNNAETPMGVDMVWSRETDRYLRGTSFTGADYNVPVSYWLPVNWNGIGIHDTSYRNSYGGTIYQGNGSNGCINAPKEAVQKIYENVRNNTPVIIYKS